MSKNQYNSKVITKMLSLEDRVKIVLLQAKLESVTLVQRKWRTEFNEIPPHENTIRNVYNKFCKTGCVTDEKRSGRPAIDGDKVDQIRNYFEAAPLSSIRRASGELGVPYSTIQKTLKYTIKMKTYHITSVQALLVDDYLARQAFCEDMIQLILDDPNIMKNICFSDESIFKLDGKVNKHNCIVWGYENPHLIEETPMKSPSVHVWAAMFHNKLIGPYFFDENVTGESYLNMLQTYFIPSLKRCHRFSSTIFQQDGAPPHWARSVRTFLDESFPRRWIGRSGPTTWPARSPDLTPLDYFLWGYIKEIVYKQKPRTTDELREFIVSAFQSVNSDLLQNVFANFEKRLVLCIQNDGGHF